MRALHSSLCQSRPISHLLLLLATGICGCTEHTREKSASRDTTHPSAARIELATSGNPPQRVIDVVGLSPGALAAIEKLAEPARADVLRVYVASLDDPPGVLGTISIEGALLRFTPRYPFEPGLRYRAVFRASGIEGAEFAKELSADLELPPDKESPPTEITAIYPSADALPENQLKFYLHFSAPMSRGEAYRHIHLFEATGKEVEAAFLELGEELWDPVQRRFTLLCDPGRVKRGLKPREELGPVLVEGKDYTLVVDRAWRDAAGRELAAGGEKKFHVLAPDDTPIDPEEWQVEAPKPAGREPLVVRFGESLDHSLVSRVLEVTTADDERVAGAGVTTDNETCWKFTPIDAWAAGDYHLVAYSTLEDLAGNAIGRPFEVDELRPIQRQIVVEKVAVPFTVK